MGKSEASCELVSGDVVVVADALDGDDDVLVAEVGEVKLGDGEFCMEGLDMLLLLLLLELAIISIGKSNSLNFFWRSVEVSGEELVMVVATWCCCLEDDVDCCCC